MENLQEDPLLFDVVWDMINLILNADRPPVGVMRWKHVPFGREIPKLEEMFIADFCERYLNLHWSLSYAWPEGYERPIPEGNFGLIQEYPDNAETAAYRNLRLQQRDLICELRDKIYQEGWSLAEGPHAPYPPTHKPVRLTGKTLFEPSYQNLNLLERAFLVDWVFADRGFELRESGSDPCEVYLSHTNADGRPSCVPPKP